MNVQRVQQMVQFFSLSQTEDFFKNSQIYVNEQHDNLNDDHQTTTLPAAFQELQQICMEEDYSLEILSRQNRSNPFI